LFKLLCEKHGKNNIKWLNENKESYNHYDFEVLDKEGNLKLLIECKGTPREKPTFYLTSDEWDFFLENSAIYQLYRIFNTDDGEMNAICINNLLESILNREVVPYLIRPEVLKENRVFLTLIG
jgi:hypothetical protein